MATPKYIKYKAEALDRALAQVAKLSSELEAWYAKQTDEYRAQDFFCDERLDIPYEFSLSSVLAELEAASEGNPSY